MIQYHLSRRLEKECFERGRMIHVALPNPPAEGDVLAWARSVLAVPPETIRGAEEVELLVQLKAGGEGLTELLGGIVDAAIPGNLYTRVIACEVTIAGAKPRSEDAAIKWPGYAMIDGRRWPRDGQP
jgi:hypothetical protein